ncbi:MAG: hypothetical protein JW715_05735 [Sedimentisphaerales bacterium]|nr:hypothetical protein [Sedimentisphaerales bacterium]
MTRNLIVIGAMMAMLLAANPTQADICEIVNGSFEDNGRINNLADQDPNGWIAEIPPGQFTAKTDASWSTDGSFSLNIASQWFQAFTAGDTAKVSQQICLADVDEIKFDMKLETYTGAKWNPNDVTVFVMIDDNIVWEPNNAVPDIRGIHLEQVYEVEDQYRADELHTISFGLMVNVDTASGFFEFYRAWWDNIESVLICNGGGVLAGDFNRDCYVDMNDLKLAADVWLAEVPASDRYNLNQDDDTETNGIVNFMDFSILAGNWLLNSYPQEQQ